MSKSKSPEVIATAAALLNVPGARLRLPEVLALLRMSRSHWYDGIARSVYPKPTRIGRRAVAVERLHFEPDGAIRPVEQTAQGILLPN